MTTQADLQQKVDLLTRTLYREREAKKQAEQKLETYSREIYEANLLLREQTKQAQKKQEQLSFLSNLAAETWQHHDLNTVIENYLARCCDFLHNSCSVQFELQPDYQLEKLKIAQPHLSKSTVDKTAIHTLFRHLDCLKLSLELTEQLKCKQINIKDYLESNSQHTPLFSSAFIVPLYQNKENQQNSLGLACFFFEHKDEIDIIKLQTIESSRNTLILALSRKINETNQAQQLAELEYAHQALKQTQQQLIDAEKLASLGMLSAGVAHEINNPVGYVMSNIDTMTDYIQTLQTVLKPLSTTPKLNTKISHRLIQDWQVEEGDYLLEDSQKILTSSIEGLNRIKEIVEALRSFSRMDNHELEAFDVNESIEHSLKMVHNELKYHYQVITDLKANKPIMGNDGQLQQVFINLFINAKHAMDDTGTLTIKSWVDKARVRVSIQDTGTGIKEDDLKQIFTPFFTTKKQGEGTGLGLAIAYSILQQHHAKVEINTELGKGTEFVLSFFTFE